MVYGYDAFLVKYKIKYIAIAFFEEINLQG